MREIPYAFWLFCALVVGVVGYFVSAFWADCHKRDCDD